ncbi:MAG TPA: YgiT-type zinc finger protein [Abditibacteriaceae bacterium]|jgi:YgiT-type zinc finger domain-containing protein
MTKPTVDLTKIPCSECGGEVKPQLISQEFEREGLCVEVSGVRALVCVRCGEVYFEPGGAQALTESVNSLFALARRNGQHKGTIRAKTQAKHRTSKRKIVA